MALGGWEGGKCCLGLLALALSAEAEVDAGARGGGGGSAEPPGGDARGPHPE